MKRVLTVLLSLVLALASFTTLSGCFGGEDGGSTSTPTEEKPAESNKIVLADFERFEPDFQLIRLSRYFGAVNVNKDANYVKSGSTSAKVQPLGHLQSKGQPWMYFPLISTRFEYNYSDFTYYESVSMWIYSAETDSVNVEFGLVERMIDITNVVTLPGDMQRIKPGWNKIVYYPDLEQLNLTCDVNNLLGVYLRFPNTPSTDLADAPVFYIDDVTLDKAETRQNIKEVIKLDPGEIMNFDKDWQRSLLIVETPYESATPDVTVVKASEEAGVSVIDDGRTEDYLLKLVTKPCDQKGWWGIEIPSKVIKNSGITGIAKAERSKYKFKFDVYSASVDDTWIYPDYGIAMWYDWYGDNFHIEESGKWLTYEITLDKISTYTSLSGIRVRWPEHGGSERTFYFDNFRLEYEGK